MKSYLLVAWLVYILCNDFVLGDEQRRLELKINRHQPCTKAGGSPSERIRFPSIDDAPLQPDPDKGDGCYLIKGTVQVLKPLSGTLQLYVETKYGTKAPTEPCHGADDSNCGGAGSCVYCDACEGIKDLSKSAVQLVIGKQAFDCKTGLVAKNYTDIKISFCMPTKADFLKTQKIDEDFWNRYGASGQMVFITMYIFNRPINTMARSDLEKIASPDSDQVIGCHKLVGSIYDPSSSSS